ncbi:MBL fold metallo-hydrolase [bacterium]|nr:MBL fold metallo-hydrolase [bacterium]
MKMIADPIKIHDKLYCLGSPFLPVYLLDGPEPVLFDAGMSFMSEHYQAEIEKVLGRRSPKYLFLSHMHFDHCGAVGYLKGIYPGLTICSAAIGAETIKKPSALNLINQLSDFPGLNENQKFKPFTVDRILEDGEAFILDGGKRIEIIATPGHTRDMLSFYLPDDKTLIPSEAAGVPAEDNHVYTEFLVDCYSYFQSLEMLSTYSFDTILFAHNYIYTGTDADSFFQTALDHGYHFRDRLSELLDQYGFDTDKIGAIIKSEEYDIIQGAKQPEKAYLINLQAKIKAVNRWRNTEMVKN